MIRLHAAAVLEALRANGLDAYDTDEVPTDPAMPYAVAYPDRRPPMAYRLHGRAKDAPWRVLVMSVGSTADEARWAAERAASTLEGVRLTVEGRHCSPARLESSMPVQPDPDDEDVYTGTTVFTFTSNPV